jgi:hypothetical protein
MSDVDELIKCIKDQPESWPADACYYAKMDEELIHDFDLIENVHLSDGRWGPVVLHVLRVIMNDGAIHYIGAKVYEMSGNHVGEFEIQDIYEVKKHIIEAHEWKRVN